MSTYERKHSVIQFAKKTGDYSVLSHADLCVIALTLSIDRREKALKKAEVLANSTAESTSSADSASQLQEESKDEAGLPETVSAAEENIEVLEVDTDSSSEDEAENATEKSEGRKEDIMAGEELEEDGGVEREPLDVSLVPLSPESQKYPGEEGKVAAQVKVSAPDVPLFEDPSDEDDGEGEWVTPSNIGIYKSQALELVPSADISDPFITVSKKSKNRRRNNAKQADSSSQLPEKIVAGCMTADFAMQNVVLQMGLNLVGLEGRRIQKVKNWVLRCHACYKCVHISPSIYTFFLFNISESVRTTQRNSALHAEIQHYCVRR